MTPIVLLSDFGTKDTYVGQMKGAMLEIFPTAEIVDLCHDIPPYGIEGAAYLLTYCYRVFPEKSVFVCVVDPGVGTRRAALAMRADNRFFIAPDNGLLSILRSKFPQSEVRVLDNPEFWRHKGRDVSFTFHGRDVFGPAGAYLAKSRSVFTKLGPLRKRIAQLAYGPPQIKGRAVQGRIIHIDRFGNLLTNIESGNIPGYAEVNWRRYRIQTINPTYGSIAKGRIAAVKNSFGLLEIAMREQSCAEKTRARCGESVKVSWRK